MSEETDFSAAIDKLREMLSNDEGKQTIENIMSAFGNSNSENEDTTATANKTASGGEDGENTSAEGKSEGDFGSFDMGNIEMMLKLQRVMSAMQNADTSKQAGFLKSLEPLLRPDKRGKINNAMKLLNIGKMIEVLKNI